MTSQDRAHRCGYVALVGRPNVGKSTLLNHLLGQKISITSRKPQTTRHRILGIKTTEKAQVIYVDSPGLHRRATRAMNRYMNRTAKSVLNDVDVVIVVVEALQWTADDDMVISHLQQIKVPVILAINKIDKVKLREELLPFMQHVSEKYAFAQVLPISAKAGNNLQELEGEIYKLLPESIAFYPQDQITDRSERFMAAEIVREKLMRSLGQELPYNLTVEIEAFKEQDKINHISALVWVERENQKAIVIGNAGARIKDIGRKARLDMEQLFGKKVFLEIWVKVKEGWSNDERALQSLGYRDE